VPNLVPASAFRFVHRDIGGLYEAFGNLPIKVFVFRRQSDAADTQAGCHTPGPSRLDGCEGGPDRTDHISDAFRVCLESDDESWHFSVPFGIGTTCALLQQR
jgi:hypothetical protein